MYQVYHYKALIKLEGLAKFAGLLLAPAKGAGLWSLVKSIFALEAKETVIKADLYLNFVFSSNTSNF